MNNEIFVQFWSGAVVGLIEWWIENSFPCSSEELTENLFSILSSNEVIPDLHS